MFAAYSINNTSTITTLSMGPAGPEDMTTPYAG
jgi:hypothetical protein